jgi:hypothetical protein
LLTRLYPDTVHTHRLGNVLNLLLS